MAAGGRHRKANTRPDPCPRAAHPKIPRLVEVAPLVDARRYVRDMLDCCARIEDYTAGLGRDELVGARLLYDAALWNITVLGEAANNIPDAVQQAHPEIPWADITGTRHRIVHGYGSIRDQIVLGDRQRRHSHADPTTAGAAS